jgi:hypothetical protein
MQNEIYIIIILFIWALAATAMCVNLVKDIWDNQDEIGKINLERNFFKAECEKLSAWLPIETAPKDRFNILLYRPDVVFVGYYGGANSGWRHNAPGLDAIWPLPTHWRSLPSLPDKEPDQ